MFELINNAPWEDMWQQMDAFMRYPFRENPLKNNGLKTLINRPHNLINIKDKDGKVVGQRLEVVTTPFKKNEVKVSVSGNVLTVKCGDPISWDVDKDGEETRPPEKDMRDMGEDYVYCGISSRIWEFSIRLSNDIDKSAIKAKNEDGVLKVELPFKDTKNDGDVTNIEVE